MSTLVTGGTQTSSITTRTYDSAGTAGWTANHGGNVYGIVADPSGNVYTVGSRVSSLTTRKYTGDGTLSWSKDHGASVYAAALNSSGQLHTAGNYTGTYTTRKYDVDGTVLWSRNYHGANLRGIAVDSSETTYVAGAVSSSTTTRVFDSGGTESWNANHGLQVNGIAVDADGNVYTGGVGDSGSSNDTTRKYNSSGTLQWSVQHGVGNPATVNCIAVDADGNVYTGGTRVSGSPQVTTRKYDTDGSLLWTADHGAEVKGIAVDSEGNVYTGGVDTGSYTTRKYDSSGSLLWSVQHGTTVWCVHCWEAAAVPGLPISLGLGVPFAAFAALPGSLADALALAVPTVTVFPDPPNLAAFTTPPQTFYRLYLSGNPVVELPLIAFQCRRRYGDSTWLDVDVAGATATTVSLIAARIGAELIIYAGTRVGTVETSGPFIRTTITEYRDERTAGSSTLRITGRVIPTAYSTTSRILVGIQQRGKNNGLRTVKASVDFLLRPGDTVFDGVASWTAGSILYLVGTRSNFMQVTEAA